MRLSHPSRGNWPLIIFVVVGVLVPYMVTTGFQLRLATLVCIYAILSMSFNVLFGYAGQISLGQQSFFAIAGYAVALLQTKAGLSFFVAAPLSLLICAVVALVIGLPLLRLRTHYLAMATLSFALVLTGVANRWIDFTGGTAGVMLPAVTLGDASLTRNQVYYSIFVVTTLVLLVQNFIVSNHIGRALQAIRDDETAASALGVDVTVHKLRVFVLAAVLAGIAGIGFALVSRQVSPSFGEFPTLVSILTIAVVGGLGTKYGPVLGAIVVVLAPQLLTRFGEFETLIYGACLLLFLIFMPHGISGLIGSLVKAVPGRTRTPGKTVAGNRRSAPLAASLVRKEGAR
jgi:branched-chain amino acid transport system permease protein